MRCRVTRWLVSFVFFLATVALAPPAAANGILLTGDGAREPTGGSSRRTVRLKAHRVTAVVKDHVAEVTVEQVFHNHSAAQLEGSYLFPLPEGAVVSQFAMTMLGKMVQGEVLESKQARRIYEGIVRQRRDPGLLEYVGRGLFRARVFPIEPHKDLTIRLVFQQVLPEDQGTLEFRYPLATDRMNGAPVEEVAVDVQIESTVELKAVYGPYQKLDVTRDGGTKARVGYESKGRRQDRDFLLYVGRSPDAIGFSSLSHKAAGQDGTFMAVLAPSNRIDESRRAPRDVVFVLDTSGSMEGPKIEQARRALAYGVRTLRARDRFNIYAFSTSIRPFRSGLVAATPELREAAVTWLGQLRAAGGTNIEAALTEAVGGGGQGRSRTVVFLTDGRPTVGARDPGALVRIATDRNASRARVFTFGVGYDLDVKLLDRIAAATNGTRDYVAPKEDIEIVTGRFFRKVRCPVLTEAKLDLGPGVYDVYPKHLGDIFAGGQIVVFGRYLESGERHITLSGKLGTDEVVHEYRLALRSEEGPDFVERLWAHRKVAFLLDEIRLKGASQELRDEVVALATRHAIVTPYTSGLVVEESELSRVPRDRTATGSRVSGARGGPVLRDEEIPDHVETDNDLPYEESFGQSDAPFEGPAHAGSIGIGGGAGGAFKRRGGSRDLGTGGGGRKKFDDAVDDALRWLAAHQSPSGGWEAAGFDRWCDGRPYDRGDQDVGRGHAAHDVGVTGLALSAFLGAGYTNRGRHPFAKVVSRGLRYLKNVQDPEGCFGPRGDSRYVLDSAWAALAMVEAYGMTGSPIFKGSAQRALDFIAIARNPYAAWGYGVKTGDNDVWLSSWMAMVLRSATMINADAALRGKPPPLVLDASTADGIGTWLAAITARPQGHLREAALTAVGREDRPRSEGVCAAGLLSRILLGDDPHKSDAIQNLIPHCLESPRWSEAEGAIDPARWHHLTYGWFFVGGKRWDTWKRGMEKAISENQRRDTDYCELKGSWDPHGPWSARGGRVWATALMARSLEHFYSYPRGFTDRLGTTTLRHTRRKPQELTDEERARVSEALRRRMEADSEAETRRRNAGRVETVLGHTFVLHPDGRWIDTKSGGKAVTKQVEALSDDYFALLRDAPGVARYLALGERVVFVLDDKVYEIVPAK